jgi:two-component system sensor histidine kinase VicK
MSPLFSGRTGPARKEAASLPGVRHSILRKMVTQWLALTTITVFLLGILSFVVTRSILMHRVFSQLSDAASAREDLLADGAQQDRERTALLAVRPEWKDVMTSQKPTVFLERMNAELQSAQVPVLGMTLFDAAHHAIGSIGERSPVPLFSLESTMLVPSVDAKRGWHANDVYVPLLHGGEHGEFLAVRYGVQRMLASVFALQSIGQTARVTIAQARGGEITVIDHSAGEPLRSFPLGSMDDAFLGTTPLSLAAQGNEGEADARDERGTQALAAERYIPLLGWGLVVQMDSNEAFQSVTLFGISLLLIGTLLLLLSALLASIVARALVSPLLRLSRGMQALRPGSWILRRSVFTGDEVEQLDRIATDLAARLKDTYDHLEEKVNERTGELRRQYTLDRTILETVAYGIIITDRRGIITDVNPAALRLLRFERDDLMGKKGNEALLIMERTKAYGPQNHPLTGAIELQVGYRSHPSTRANMGCKDKTTLPVHLMVTPLLQDGQQQGALMVFQDMTEERQVDYIKSEFISLASHQLRTPLSSIRWYVELLGGEKSAMTAVQGSYLSEIESAAKRMADLIDALLHIARLEGEGLTIEKCKTNLSDLLGALSKEWETMAKEHEFRLLLSLPQEPAWVMTDPLLLQIVLQNFFTNALKYSPDAKRLQVNMSLAGDHVSISVRDTGIGIPGAEQQRVFEKFFRARNVRQMDTDGNGLGLYMSKNIVQKLGGTIRFDSEEGKGSVFTVTLPLLKE